MKIQALILVFALAVFLTETVSFLPAMNNAPAEVCCKKKTKQAECRNEKEDNSKVPENCDDKPDCSYCCVSCVFTFQPQYEWLAQQFLFKQHYLVENTGNTSFYDAFVWKPPDGVLIFTG